MSVQRPARTGLRRSPGWRPNQHGAWAMLASPLLVGAIASGFDWSQVVLGAFWFVGYFAFYATSVWLKSKRLLRHRQPVTTYAAASAALGLPLAIWRPDLLSWAPLFVLPLGVGLWAAGHKRERDLLAGLTTTVGSSLMTVVSYAAGPGEDLHRAWLLAAVQAAYFAGTVFYVKSVIRERGNPRFLAWSAAFHAVVTIACLFLSPWLAALFGVLTLRAALVPRLGPTPKQVGIAEVAATVAVAATSLLVIP